ncbi:MAG: hypothetical protein L3J69_17985 [Desulfobacula sp.]|nr:hypothetical protein [Desulfobacula sp.]
MPYIINTDIWKKKAMAFVIRSHRHLWGKNNEDPLAYLFTRGLKNEFCKQLYLGWNKFGQERPFQNWRFETRTNQRPDQPKKFLLPAGIVFPYIIDKNLISVFIHSFSQKSSSRITLVPGSSSATIILGETKQTIVIIEDLFDGLFLFQEAGQICSVVIHPDHRLPLSIDHKSLLKQATRVRVLSKPTENRISKTQHAYGMNIPQNAFEIYTSRKDLTDLFSS